MDIFISYKREDKALAQKVFNGLTQARFTVFYDTNILPSEIWSDRIARELDEAKAVVVLWSPKACLSQSVLDEAAVGLNNRKLCPALVETAEIHPDFLEVQTADLRTWRGETDHPGWRQLVLGVDECIKRVQPIAASTTPTKSKYVPVKDHSIFERLFASAGPGLKSGEAFVHILVGTVFADGQISDHELECLQTIKKRSRGPLRDHFDEYFEKGKVAFAYDFNSALATACKALPRDLVDTAFANAALMAHSDGSVSATETQYLNATSKLLGLSRGRANQILEVVRIQHAH